MSADLPPMHYADWFRRHAVTRPDVPAIATPKVKLTYRAFHEALHAVAHRLADSGVRHGQMVGLLVGNHALHCALIAALNRMGAVPLSLARSRDADLAAKLPRGLTLDHIVAEHGPGNPNTSGAISVDIDWLKPAGNEGEWRAPGLRNGDSLAHMFASSGTTGSAKVVGYSMRELEARLFKRSIGVFAAARTGKAFVLFGLNTSVGYQAAFSAFWSGGTVFAGWPFKAIPGLIARVGIERIEGSPAQYQAILKAADLPRFDLPSLRYAVIGGSVIPQRLIAAVRTRFCKVLIGQYGAAEIGPISFGPVYAKDPTGRCGHLMPWVDAQVVDGDGNVLPAGKEGLLRFRCEEMATQYLNDAEASTRHFRDGWFYPGDTGTIGEDRALTVTGRSAERINAGGVKIAPHEIEAVVTAFAGVQDCAVFGVADSLGVENVWAAVVADRGVDLEALRKHCGAKLGARAPQRFLRLADLPRNDAGKIVRSELQRIAQMSEEQRRAKSLA